MIGIMRWMLRDCSMIMKSRRISADLSKTTVSFGGRLVRINCLRDLRIFKWRKR